jgi:hypothetical protein
MAAVFASTIPLLIDPMLLLLESIWVTVVPDVTLTAGTIGIVTVMTIRETGIGTETATVIALRVATTGTVVTRTQIGTGVTEGAPVAIRLIAGGEEATLVARVGGAQDVLVSVNVNVTAIKPQIPGGIPR